MQQPVEQHGRKRIDDKSSNRNMFMTILCICPQKVNKLSRGMACTPKLPHSHHTNKQWELKFLHG